MLYAPRQCSLFWDYIPESKLCFCLNLCRPPGTHSIRPIQKLLNCQQRDARGGCCSRHSSRWGATKNSAVALISQNTMISIHQRSARTNGGKTTLIYGHLINSSPHDFNFFLSFQSVLVVLLQPVCTAKNTPLNYAGREENSDV